MSMRRFIPDNSDRAHDERGRFLPCPGSKNETLRAKRKQSAASVQKPTVRSRVTNGRQILAGIDQRSPNARRYRDLVALVAADQGGLDHCSEAKLQLIRRFAALSVQAEAMEAQLANGAAIDITEYSGKLRRARWCVSSRAWASIAPHETLRPTCTTISKSARAR